VSKYTCARCGRRFDTFEAMIDDMPYCHPFDLPLHERSCYQEQSYEESQSWRSDLLGPSST
jgi:hypothetical protein